ncbi:NADH:ubiquinone oxidoreductase complex I intermediate-associated protein 30 [Rhypophila sp. PSN 637]
MVHGANFVYAHTSRPWDENDWTASDDRVRGGKSISRLSTQPPQQHQDNDNDHDGGLATTCAAAKFSGNLDITALGGAGFASQRTTIFEGQGAALDLVGSDALVLKVVHHAEDADSTPEYSNVAAVAKEKVKKYTVVFKDTILPKRPDGREQSTISWESDFSLAGVETETITLPFTEFKPTYRGKPVEDPEAKLDWGSIKRVSIMVRSFFGEQHGPFSLVISSIAARKPRSQTGCVIL